MSTGEGDVADPREGQSKPSEDGHRGERIGVGGGDDAVSRIQLAARWAEAFAKDGDSLGGMLRRFRLAYEYLDAVIHGVEPPELDSAAEQARTPAVAAQGPTQPAPPAPPPWARPQDPPVEPRPWG